MATFSATLPNFGQRIAFEDVERRIAECGIDASRLTADGARGTLFRLLIPDVAAVARIIYLDYDIIVNRDIAELWELPYIQPNSSMDVGTLLALQNTVRGTRRVSGLDVSARSSRGGLW